MTKQKKHPYLATNLRILRNSLGLTQDYIAEKIGVNRTTYLYWESGNCEPSFSKLTDIINLYVSKGLKVDYNYLLSKPLG